MTTIDFHGVRLDMAYMGDGITSAWKPEETALVIQTVEPGDRVLVAGGGFGWSACVVASIVGVDNVVVYEANPELATHLSHNIRVDGRPLRVLNLALSDATGQGQLWEHPHWGASSLHRRIGEHGRMIPVRTWDINDAIRRDLISVLVLDVEGSEWDIARALDWFPIRAAVVEVHHKYLSEAGKDPDMVKRRMVDGGLVNVREIAPVGNLSKWIAGVRA